MTAQRLGVAPMTKFKLRKGTTSWGEPYEVPPRQLWTWIDNHDAMDTFIDSWLYTNHEAKCERWLDRAERAVTWLSRKWPHHHYVVNDHCGIPGHRYCSGCYARMPDLPLGPIGSKTPEATCQQCKTTLTAAHPQHLVTTVMAAGWQLKETPKAYKPLLCKTCANTPTERATNG